MRYTTLEYSDQENKKAFRTRQLLSFLFFLLPISVVAGIAFLVFEVTFFDMALGYSLVLGALLFYVLRVEPVTMGYKDRFRRNQSKPEYLPLRAETVEADVRNTIVDCAK